MRMLMMTTMTRRRTRRRVGMCVIMTTIMKMRRMGKKYRKNERSH